MIQFEPISSTSYRVVYPKDQLDPGLRLPGALRHPYPEEREYRLDVDPELGFVRIERDRVGYHSEVYTDATSHPIYDYSGIVSELNNPYRIFIEKITRAKHPGVRAGWIFKWSQEKAGKTISKHFHGTWLEMVSKCNSVPMALQKRAYACFGKMSFLERPVFENVLLESKNDPYIYADILKYRHIAYAMFLSFRDFPRDYRDTSYSRINTMSSSHRSRASFTNMPAHMPAHVYEEALTYLSNYGDFPRVLRSIEDWVFIYFASQKSAIDRDIAPYERMLEKSSQDEMVAAHRLLAENLEAKLKRRSFRHVQNTYGYMLDAPIRARPAARITGIARDSIAWHEQFVRQNPMHAILDRNRDMDKLLFPDPFPEPKFEVAESPHVRRLIDVESLLEESDAMHNCVSSYAGRCSQGMSFIFSYNNPKLGRATVELDYNGEVIQCLGAGNQMDAASKAAYRTVKKLVKNNGKTG